MRSARSSLVRPLSLRACSIAIRQHRIIPALRLKHRSGGSPRQEPLQAAVALRSASLRLGVRHGICVAKMLDNVGLRYPHRASGAKAPRTLRPLPLLRFAVSAIGGAHLCSIQYYLRFWLSSCRTSLAVSALRIMRYCPKTHRAPCQQRMGRGFVIRLSPLSVPAGGATPAPTPSSPSPAPPR